MTTHSDHYSMNRRILDLRRSLVREVKLRTEFEATVEATHWQQTSVLLTILRACDRPIATQAWSQGFTSITRAVEVPPRSVCHSHDMPRVVLTVSADLVNGVVQFSVHALVQWRSHMYRACHKSYEGTGDTLAAAYDACLGSLRGPWAAAVRRVLTEVVE